MKNPNAIKLLEDWQSTKPELYPIADTIYQHIKQQAPELIETVKYGGILFSRTEAESSAVCGVFVYTGHVSLEFSQGAQLNDPHRALEGSGKYRRHLKFKHLDDLGARYLDDYLTWAIQA